MSVNLFHQPAAPELAPATGQAPAASPCERRGAERRASPPPNIFWHAGQVASEARLAQRGAAPCTLWLTGLSGAGKSTIAYELEQRLHEQGRPAFVLDGDNLRHHLNRDLGFSAADRRENLRRTAEVARLMNEAGLIAIVACISPLRLDREMAAELIGPEQFVEVHVSTPVAVCEARDPKGLYAKARAGEIPCFTGVSAPYEAPPQPAISLDTGELSVQQAASALCRHLAQRGA